MGAVCEQSGCVAHGSGCMAHLLALVVVAGARPELQGRSCGLYPQRVAVFVQHTLFCGLHHLVARRSERHRHQVVVQNLLDDFRAEAVQRRQHAGVHSNRVDVPEGQVQELLPAHLGDFHGELHMRAQ
jgi:hypothetical protein